MDIVALALIIVDIDSQPYLLWTNCLAGLYNQRSDPNQTHLYQVAPASLAEQMKALGCDLNLPAEWSLDPKAKGYFDAPGGCIVCARHLMYKMMKRSAQLRAQDVEFFCVKSINADGKSLSLVSLPPLKQSTHDNAAVFISDMGMCIVALIIASKLTPYPG